MFPVVGRYASLYGQVCSPNKDRSKLLGLRKQETPQAQIPSQGSSKHKSGHVGQPTSFSMTSSAYFSFKVLNLLIRKTLYDLLTSRCQKSQMIDMLRLFFCTFVNTSHLQVVPTILPSNSSFNLRSNRKGALFLRTNRFCTASNLRAIIIKEKPHHSSNPYDNERAKHGRFALYFHAIVCFAEGTCPTHGDFSRAF